MFRSITKAAAAVFIAAAMFILSGCDDYLSSYSEKSCNNKVRYLCVGMEKSKRFGTCIGCSLDVVRMDMLLRERMGYTGTVMTSEEATRRAVASKMSEYISEIPEDGLFIFYYSGHGGQENLSDWDTEEPEGYDSMDEYLCLYDSYLLDDEIWKLISKCKGRVFLCFDACHSQTMFRSVVSDIASDRGLAIPLDGGSKMIRSSGFGFRQRAIPLDDKSIRMLCWSGCMESEYSFGGDNGGVMTNRILARWRRGIGYTELWEGVKNDVNSLNNGQHPVSTSYGTGFSGEEAFR